MKPVVSFVIFAAVCFISVIPSSHGLPFVLIPGFGDDCRYHFMPKLMAGFEHISGSIGFCVDVGSFSDTIFETLLKQTNIVCEKIKKMTALKHGYNILGLSQGALIGRGVIEFCDGGPRVKNFISAGGPQAGISSAPSYLVFKLLWAFGKFGVYTSKVQKHFAPSNYVKIPTRIAAYTKKCEFLPKLNNEIPGKRNATFKERFASLENLVLIMFKNETVLKPKETAWFGFHPVGTTASVLCTNKTKLYIEDWIGLRTLNEAGKVRFVSAPGDHLNLDKETLMNSVIPFLKNETVSNRQNDQPNSGRALKRLRDAILKLRARGRA